MIVIIHSFRIFL